MNVEFINTEEVTKMEKISQEKKVTVKIIDEVEGNINMKLMLKDDDKKKDSYTTYKAIDSHQAEIWIVNAQNDKYTSTQLPILLGTYKKNYSLFLEYVLWPKMSDSVRMISLKFFIKKIN